MVAHQAVNIRSLSRNRAEQVGYYRFLENENVSRGELAQSLATACQLQVEERHVLAISDSTEINLQSHAGRLKTEGLGVVGNNRDLGFFLHPTLILNASDGFPLGLSAVQMWTRDPSHQDKHQRNYQTQKIEEKESYKWLRSASQSMPCLKAGGVKRVTHIGDRESDLYEEFATVPDAVNDLLVRVCQDRRLWNQKASLYEYLSQQPSLGTYWVEVLADARLERPPREAWLSVRSARVSIQRPQNLSALDYPPYLSLNAVEAVEINPPAGVKPIHWRLLTTHSVSCIEQALQVIQWYRWRWRIEQLFATLKRAGLNLEATQLESIAAIQRLTILALSVALRILQLLFGRERADVDAGVVFNDQQQQCLEQLASTLPAKTSLAKEPLPPSLASLGYLANCALGGLVGLFFPALSGNAHSGTRSAAV